MSSSSSSSSGGGSDDDDVSMFGDMANYVYLALRLLAALVVVWYGSFASSKPRLFSGVLAAAMSGFLSFTFLEPLFEPVGLELARVALYVLAINGAFVGLSLGVMLPTVFPGLCFGASVALFVGSFGVALMPLYFPVVGGVLALIAGTASLRCGNELMLVLASVLQFGAVAASLVLKTMLPHIMDVTRGYQLLSSSNVDEDNVSFGLPVPQDVFLGIVWTAACLLVFAAIVHRDGHCNYLNIRDMFSNGYSAVPNADANVAAQKEPKASLPRDPPPVAPDAFNMFDPADLPPRLAEYANMVYSACEDLGNFFGFQDSSVRNQAEHLLILLSNNRRYMSSHILPPSVQPPSPIHALHAKVFSNYVKWCRAMGIAPHFSKMNTSMNAPPAVASRVVDLVLFFCLWGEGSNLRHMPECLWFLYHKTMEEYIKSEGYTQTRSLYAGHFLDFVVTPIYTIAADNMKKSADHTERRNYDDINEFFWSRNCLRYHYSSGDARDMTDIEGNMIGPLVGESAIPVAEALESAPKTFLEKRSWFRGMLALNRILEWHIVTFYLLAVIAFARELVWGWVYSLQVGSGVFWIFNALHLFWAFLEVWGSYPGIHLSGTEVCGSIFILVARFLTLVYQTLYIMWAFAPQKGIYLGIEADSTFWWWQYIWLSMLVMIPYAIETALQFWPALTTFLCTSQNDYVQSFLNMLYPLSRLYVGKEVHESVSHSAVYIIFWLTMMTWKLFFSYIFEVYSMVLPTLELTDDYINYPNQSFLKMMALLLMRWTPQFIVYLIDMSIWYAAWQAFAGTAVGFSDHLGDIRSIDDIRQNFGRAPEHFCKKMLSPDAGSRRGSSASFLGTNSTGNMASEGSSLLGTDPQKLQSYVNRLLDVRIQKWVMFSAAWNEIIDYFREEDIISNDESDNLKFSQFDGFSQAIYLPVFQTAGVIDDVMSELERPSEEYRDTRTGAITDEIFFKPIMEHVTRQTAVSEVWELGSFLFVQILGPTHSSDVNAIATNISTWMEDSSLSSHMKLEKMRTVMTHFVGLVMTLQKGIGKRKAALKQRSSNKQKNSKAGGASKQRMSLSGLENSFQTGGMRKVVSATSLNSLEIDRPHSRMDATEKSSSGTEKRAEIDALRDQVRDKLRSCTHAMKSLLKDADADTESRDVLDRLTFLGSMENGFFWNDDYASDQLDDVSKNSTFKAVLRKLHGLLCMHPDEAEPKSKEVRRRLTFFVNSLFMDIPDAPSIHDMFSWNVLTPYYNEDVTYSKGDLEKRSDALGVSTLLYLQTLFRADWNNFLERQGITDEDKIWSKKYVDETRRWASIRSQTLSRTVNGMMYCEKALRLLANLERLDEDTTNDLMGEKFGYVVSCQVYGNMKRNQDSKADDIDALLHRFPHLRVAYIDTIRINRAGASVYYSVLVKSDRKGGIQEIYRVRLPGNPVIGEGKPENQNHAMVFTRGEFLQTIDMNQEGYFEEALKMRNVLQEFAKREGPLPTTIIGLREHIFTGSVSSLANYMAMQEMSFVTLGQRVLTRPLHIRLHYGHPDVFDKLFFITRGGISKSSKGINLSEDIFAGYNNIIRGGTVGFKEYVQVGKGRDVGMSQIYKFEAKLSQGAAEQSLSRDVYRMCHRLDFFRLLSFYYGGIGHYFSNVLTILTVWVVVYLMALLAIFDLEKIGDRVITPMGTIQMMLGGLGLLQTIPLFATLGVERGWWASIQEIFLIFVTGGPLHFMFHIQTKATYMAQTILVGGAKYRATGRGFVTQHSPMDGQFRFFASSHLYLGVELGSGLLLVAMFSNAKQYFGRTWSLWLASASFICSPFWFNPLTFDWNVVVNDYSLWIRWMRGASGGSSRSWSMWWNEENAFHKNMPFASKCLYYSKALMYLLVGEGIRRSSLFKTDVTLSTPLFKVGDVVIFIVVVFVTSRLFSVREASMPYPVRRTIGILLFSFMVAGIFTLFLEDTNYMRYALAGYYMVGALCLVGLLHGVKAVKTFYMVHDLICGHIIFIPLFVLAALQLPNHIQTWLLYHNALSADVVVSDILRYARKSQESSGVEVDEDLAEQVADLKRIVQRQEQLLANAGFVQGGKGMGGAGMNDSVADILASHGATEANPPMAQPALPVRAQSAGMYGRAFSMSGIDVWGDMALGDTGELRQESGVPPSSMQGNTMPDNTMQGFSFTQPDTMPPR